MSNELKKIAAAIVTTGCIGFGLFAGAPALAEIAIDSPAPLFTLKNQNGADFNLEGRRGKGWTVLFFYPKAHSPGCTTQVCAFRDTIKRIQAKNAELIGVSADDGKTIKEFHDKHQLNFDLVSDSESKVIDQYGIKVPMVGIAKRWTFILDPQLIVRSIEPNVDPALDSEWTAEILDELQNPAPAAAPAAATPAEAAPGK